MGRVCRRGLGSGLWAELMGGFLHSRVLLYYLWFLWDGLWVELWEEFRRGQPTWKT